MAHERGRQPIGLDQPPNSGSSYPFTSVSDELADLFADFFLFYEGPEDPENTVVYSHPFEIAWCYGFGTNEVTAPEGWSTPTHAYDLIVHDQVGEVVFDSTTATTFSTALWGDRLRIVEWSSGSRICRCVVHTEWTSSDIADGRDREYDTYIVPARAVLAPEAYASPPKRITSIKVGETVVSGKPVYLQEGYNVDLSGGNALGFAIPVLSPGASASRSVDRVTFVANPGSGGGKFPGCGEQPRIVRTINGMQGNSNQNFVLDAEGCLRLQRPVIEVEGSQRSFSYWHPSLSDAQAAATLQLSNDCRNCCDCEYFARTYQGIKRQWFLYRDVAQSLVATRQLYVDSRQRWLEAKSEREADILQVKAVIEGGGKVAWGINLCNAGECCLLGLRIYLTWVQYIDGIPSAPVVKPYHCSQTMLDNRSECDTPRAILPIVYGENEQIHCYVVDYLDSQTTLSVYGRQCIADALTVPPGSAKLMLHVMVEWNGLKEDPEAPESCLRTPLEAETVAAVVRDIWTASDFEMPERVFAHKESGLKILDPTDPACRGCRCEE